MGSLLSSAKDTRKHVLIIGASFSAITLTQMLGNDYVITIVDKKEYFEV